MNDTGMILEYRGVSKTYPGKVRALGAINLNIGKGRIVGLLGPNGSGKSTLIKLANGLLTPTTGEVRVAGNPIGIVSKQITSYLPERGYVSDWMRVSDLMGFFLDFFRDFNFAKSQDMLTRLAINPDSLIKTLSKGEKEKVQLIMAMSRDAELYMLDEPIGGVDPATRDYILKTIISNYSENATIVISTHLIADIEQVLDDAIFINRGEVLMASSVDSIREERGMSVDALFREVFKC